MLVPGRILVIDDARTRKEKRKVDTLVRSLRKEGESVVFAQSMPESEDVLENVRLLIVDLILVEGDKEASYELLASIIQRTSQKTGFLIVAIWTKYSRDPEKDKKILQELEQIAQYPRAVFLEPFGKDISPKELIERIKKSMESKPECGLLLETERCIEKARDNAVSDIISTASIPVILKALSEEIGDVALHREMVNLFLKVLSRYSKPSKEMKTYIEKIGETSADIDSEKYGQIYSLQSYYEINPEEHTWTGDVLKKEGEYAVVVVPSCDFAQCKKRPLEHIKTIEAFRINHSDFTNPEVRKQIKERLKLKSGSQKTITYAVLKDRSLQERFYVLKYLNDTQQNTLFHLVLDFQQVSRLPFITTASALLEKEGWERICRIDNPIIDNLLRAYSTYSSRIGIPGIPEDIVKSISKRSS